MQKILLQTKNIVILILLFAVLPQVFVNGFFAYLYNFSDIETINKLKQTHDVYYKTCINSAYVSLGITYTIAHYLIKPKKLNLWLKWILISIIYFVLFQLLIFAVIYVSGLFL